MLPTQHADAIPEASQRKQTPDTPGRQSYGGEPAVHRVNTTRRSFFAMDGISATWTVADQRRLTSIDALHTRLLEYHNNVHVRSVEPVLQSQYAALSVHQPHTLVPFMQSYSHRGGGGVGGASVLGPASVAAALMASDRPVAHLLHIRRGPPNPSSSSSSSFPSSSFSPSSSAPAAGEGEGVSAGYQPRPSGFAEASPLHASAAAASLRPTPLGREALVQALAKIPAPSSANSGSGSGGLVWIHMSDASVVPLLQNKFGLHELCAAGFSDLRAHSSFVPARGGCLVSFCSFVMVGTDVTMVKLFVYFCHGLVITHEREVHPDLSSPQPGPDVVVPRLMERAAALVGNMARHGPVYLLYSLAYEALQLQDTIIDFFARSLQVRPHSGVLSLSVCHGSVYVLCIVVYVA